MEIKSAVLSIIVFAILPITYRLCFATDGLWRYSSTPITKMVSLIDIFSVPEDILDKTFPQNQYSKFLSIIDKIKENPNLIIRRNDTDFNHKEGIYFWGPLVMNKYLPVVMIEYDDSITDYLEMRGDQIAFILIPDWDEDFYKNYQKRLDYEELAEKELIEVTIKALISKKFILIDFRYYDPVKKQRHFWPNPEFFKVNNVKQIWSYPGLVINNLY